MAGLFPRRERNDSRAGDERLSQRPIARRAAAGDLARSVARSRMAGGLGRPACPPENPLLQDSRCAKQCEGSRARQRISLISAIYREIIFSEGLFGLLCGRKSPGFCRSPPVTGRFAATMTLASSSVRVIKSYAFVSRNDSASADGAGPPVAQSRSSTVCTTGTIMRVAIWVAQPMLPVATTSGARRSMLAALRSPN